MCCVRRLHLERSKDVSGISGIGKIADGCLFTDTGEVVIHWLGSHPSINVYRSIDDVIYIHGHQGATNVVFDDPDAYSEIKDEGK